MTWCIPSVWMMKYQLLSSQLDAMLWIANDNKDAYNMTRHTHTYISISDTMFEWGWGRLRPAFLSILYMCILCCCSCTRRRSQIRPRFYRTRYNWLRNIDNSFFTKTAYHAPPTAHSTFIYHSLFRTQTDSRRCQTDCHDTADRQTDSHRSWSFQCSPSPSISSSSDMIGEKIATFFPFLPDEHLPLFPHC